MMNIEFTINRSHGERFIRWNTRMPYSVEKNQFRVVWFKGARPQTQCFAVGKDHLGQYFPKVVSVI